MGRSVRNWVAGRCVHARVDCWMSDSRSQSPRFALQRKCSRCPTSSSRDQRGHSRSRVHRAWRGVDQTEVQFVVTGVCSPDHSRLRTGFRCFVRHCLPLCGTNSARRALAVGVTPNRSVLSSWFVCYCSRSVGCAGRKGEARNPLNSWFISLCCGHLGAGLDCVSQHCPIQCFPLGCCIILHQPRLCTHRRNHRHSGGAWILRICVLDFPWQDTGEGMGRMTIRRQLLWFGAIYALSIGAVALLAFLTRILLRWTI